MSKDISKKPKRQFWKKGAARVVKYLFVICLLTFVLATFLGLAVPLELLFNLLAGWLLFLLKNISSMKWNTEMALCGCGALALAVWGGHGLLVWVSNKRVWKWSWTLSFTTMMLMLFASSVAMTGVIHQVAWMSSEPLTKSNRRARIIHNTSNAKQVFYLLVDYDVENHQLPDSLDLLVKEGYTASSEILQFNPDQGRSIESWIYLGAGERLLDDTEKFNGARVLLISPSPNRDKWLVLRSDGAVKQYNASGLRKDYPDVLKRLPNLLSSGQ